MFTCLLDANIAELGTGWAIYATGAMLLQNTSFVAVDRNASNELALFISTSAPIDYGSCTPGTTPGAAGTNVLMADGDFTGCPFLCSEGRCLLLLLLLLLLSLPSHPISSP